MVADVTVTRLAEDRFRVVTGAGFVASDLAWLRTHAGEATASVSLRDVSAEIATIGLWGPLARAILARHDTGRRRRRRAPGRAGRSRSTSPGRRSSRRASATPASSAGS